MSKTFGLTEIIKTLRSDISEAIRSGEGHGIQFELNQIEIELQTVIETGGDGKIEFKVLGVGAEVGGNLSQTKTHSIKLNLTAINHKTGTDNSGTILLSDEVDE